MVRAAIGFAAYDGIMVAIHHIFGGATFRTRR
jgi:hypothetical protein